MAENRQRIENHNERLDVLVNLVNETNSALSGAITEQEETVGDLEKLFKGLPVNSASRVDVRDTTATSGDVATGKVFYGADGKRTEGSGNISEPLNFKEIFFTPEQFGAQKIDSLNTFRAYINTDGTLIVCSQYSGAWYYDEDKGEFINIYPRDGEYSTYCAIYGYDDNRVFLYGIHNGIKGIYIFNTKTKEYKRLELEGAGNHQYNMSFFKSSDGLFFIQSEFTFDKGPYLFDPITETAHLIGGDNSKGYQIRYEDEDGNLFAWSSSQTYGGEGIVKYNREDNTFTRIYSDRSYFEKYISAGNGVFYFGTSYYSGRKDYAIVRADLKNLKFDTIETVNHGYLSRSFINDNGDLYVSGNSSDKGLFVIKNGSTEMIKISDDGTGFSKFYKYKDKLFCAYSSTSSSVSSTYYGIMSIDTNNYTVNKAYDTSMNWNYYVEFNNNLYVSKDYNNDSSNNALLMYNENSDMFEIVTKKPTSSFYGYFIKLNLYEGLTNDWFIIQDPSNGTYYARYNISSANVVGLGALGSYCNKLYRFGNYLYFLGDSTSGYPKRYDGETFTNVFETYLPYYNLYEKDGELYGRSTSQSKPNDIKLNNETLMFELVEGLYTGEPDYGNTQNGLTFYNVSNSPYYALTSVPYVRNLKKNLFQVLKNTNYGSSSTQTNGYIIKHADGDNKIARTGMMIIYPEKE